MEPQAAVDRVRALAEAQHGVVARRQLLDVGLTRERIASWRRRGRLVVQRPGVYSLGHKLLALEGRWMVAVLACGEGAVLSHRSAAALWGLRPPGASAIDVTVRAEGARHPGPGLRTHRSGFVGEAFGTVERGIPVTTVAWTLLDLAAVLRPPALRRAVEEAERRELFDLVAVDRALARAPGRTGRQKLVAVLDDMRDHGVTLTRSDVEATLLQICIDHALPRPEVNRYDNGVEVDFRWPAHGLIVELDGWAFHGSRAAFRADRARDRHALAVGWHVARFTALEVLQAPDRVAAELRGLLSSVQRQHGVR